jgi:hypothetical protein
MEYKRQCCFQGEYGEKGIAFFIKLAEQAGLGCKTFIRHKGNKPNSFLETRLVKINSLAF